MTTTATTRQRSPNYPNLSLPDAIARVRRVFDADRRAPLDRSVVAKHMGYSGISGAADKTIGSIMQYGLLERVGKGEVRVSQTAVDIFHPENVDQRRAAIATAALMPPLFRSLREKVPQYIPSSDALRSYLMRQNFLDRAISPVISAYTETCQFLEQENAWGSAGAPEDVGRESPLVAHDDDGNEYEAEIEFRRPPPPPLPEKKERQKMDGERTLMKGILSTDADFEVLVSGPVGVKEIDRLIQKLELDKEILAEKSHREGSDDD
jgi:hypothetical protein